MAHDSKLAISALDVSIPGLVGQVLQSEYRVEISHEKNLLFNVFLRTSLPLLLPLFILASISPSIGLVYFFLVITAAAAFDQLLPAGSCLGSAGFHFLKARELLSHLNFQLLISRANQLDPLAKLRYK
jgi:hypothetical protein